MKDPYELALQSLDTLSLPLPSSRLLAIDIVTNLFYIPPLSPPKFRKNGRLRPYSKRIPIKLLARMFGDDANQTFDQRVARIDEIFDILETERARGVDSDGQPKSELVRILIAHDETDRLQLYLG